MRVLSSFLFSCLLLFVNAYVLEAADSRIDLLVFASSPGEEILGCGITVAKALRENKRVKIVFLTNGDDGLENPKVFTGQEYPAGPAKFIESGRRRQAQGLRAAKILGLPEENVYFLSYPANGLKQLWEEDYNYSSRPGSSYELFRSPSTKTSFSPYRNTYGKARSGYNLPNIISDIRKIVEESRPGKIYLPSPWDDQPDRIFSSSLISKALYQSMLQTNAGWIRRIQEYYYTVSPRVRNVSKSNYQEMSGGLAGLKEQAWSEYAGLPGSPDKKALDKILNSESERFWRVPGQKDAYLEALHAEWLEAAQKMKSCGYDVNLGVVADVAEDIDDPRIDLVRKNRIFSDNPSIVSQLVGKIAGALNSGGIVPVVKHFPGLGSAANNTHQRLAYVSASRQQLLVKDIYPYRRLIQSAVPFWVMTDHAVYPAIDDKPASLSYKIQTGILREDLGFKGLIISDDLMQMGAIDEYALRCGLRKPYIGEIAAACFAAGTDIAIIYPRPGRAEEAISQVIAGVKQAIGEGKLSESEIDISVNRILKEKQRIYNVPLAGTAERMSLEAKICQKILIELDRDAEILGKYCLGAIHARDPGVAKAAREICSIPLFIMGQHEGGRVNEIRCGLNTGSAYLSGREYEKALPGFPGRKGAARQNSPEEPANYYSRRLDGYGRISSGEHQAAVDILCASLDEEIASYAKNSEEKFFAYPAVGSLDIWDLPQENLWEPRVKPFKEIPVAGLTRFPDKFRALYAYSVFRRAFDNWQARTKLTGRDFKQAFKRSFERRPADPAPAFIPGERAGQSAYNNLVVESLNGLKSELRQIKIPSGKEPLRVLCLAAHPDDEDAEALAYLKQKFSAETFILFATRGEGGENLIGAQLYEELGALRTEEAQRAADLLGVRKVYYLGEKDFGYCQDIQEALGQWNKEDALRRLVYFFRLVRPQIIITKHNKSQPHCQHQALLSLAREAFDLSGRHRFYPQTTEYGLGPWQPEEFYERKPDNVPEPLWADLVIDAQEQAGSSGQTFSELGRQSLQQHRSQSACWVKASKLTYELVKTAENPGADEAEKYSLKPREGIGASGIPDIMIADNLKVGLFEDRDNVFFVSLKSLGCDLSRISAETFPGTDLSGFDVIVLAKGWGNLIASAKDAGRKLLEFAAGGGNLLIFYQDSEIDSKEIFPYSLGETRGGVLDETLPARILIPRHELFNIPNKISFSDFNGWKQEFSRFSFPFADEKYTDLLSFQVPGSGYSKGGYLFLAYGKGSLIVTTLAWPRQLREFHRGAQKNLANMISHLKIKTTVP